MKADRKLKLFLISMAYIWMIIGLHPALSNGHRSIGDRPARIAHWGRELRYVAPMTHSPGALASRLLAAQGENRR